ncbi:MAG: LysM peptidoglycan-binding domain-containing protein [Firmicutes bacterium]|nr:LysM peptidoglycan-binding domain-containing protein [Bacillota bacterium]
MLECWKVKVWVLQKPAVSLTTWQQLWQINNLENPRLIMPGQEMILYPLTN